MVGEGDFHIYKDLSQKEVAGKKISIVGGMKSLVEVGRGSQPVRR
jgi:hypothetical protein